MKDLNEMQMGALSEMGNIGAGNAATALSQLLNIKIDIKVPHVRVVPIEKTDDWFDRADVKIAIYLRVMGEAPGKALFLMSPQSGQFLAKTLLSRDKSPDFDKDEMACSAIMEVGNVLVSSFLVALTNFSGILMQSSIPAMSMDMLGAILQGIFLDNDEVGDTVLIIDTEFSGTSDIEGLFLFLPDGDALEKLLGVFGL
ncbi:MAG: chemotaxis protein CheC [Peptococcaceae bacterium]|nr:chemotaxis protein CheC [Peptococcaceae bacterium]